VEDNLRGVNISANIFSRIMIFEFGGFVNDAREWYGIICIDRRRKGYSDL
jgi:hypothetical protein